MNTMLFPEDVANVIQSFYLCNKGDEATTDLLLAVGAELLDISPDKMLEMITEGFWWADPNAENLQRCHTGGGLVKMAAGSVRHAVPVPTAVLSRKTEKRLLARKWRADIRRIIRKRVDFIWQWEIFATFKTLNALMLLHWETAGMISIRISTNVKWTVMICRRLNGRLMSAVRGVPINTHTGKSVIPVLNAEKQCGE